MAVTKSWEKPDSQQLGASLPNERRREFWWLVASSLIVAAGLLMVCVAMGQNFADLTGRMERGEILNLNSVSEADELLPSLHVFPAPEDRRVVADRIWGYLQSHRPLPNVGALAK